MQDGDRNSIKSWYYASKTENRCNLIVIRKYMKLLIFGENSQIGRSLLLRLQQQKIDYQAYGQHVDICDHALVKRLIAQSQADFVINAVGLNDPDVAEQQPQLCHAVNALAAVNIAKCCAQYNSALVQLSTAQVFDGFKKTQYSESDQPMPTSEYGQAKYWAEQQIEQLAMQSVVLRFGLIFSAQSNNLLKSFIALAKEHQALSFPELQMCNPTHSDDCARVIIAVCQQLACRPSLPLWGVYHYGASDGTSILQFASTVINTAKKYDRIVTEQIIADEEPAFIAPQLKNAQLNCQKIMHTFGIKQLPWRRQVLQTFKEIYPNG
jgi:dTDP-4-dehydrorhamnose reductase